MRLTTLYKNQKGSSTILVLAVIIILMMLGSAVLMASVVNVRLGSKYSNWNDEYYKLDKSGQELLKKIDEYLLLAETYTQMYIQYENYKDLSAPPLPEVTNSKYSLRSAQHEFIRKQWEKISNDLNTMTETSARNSLINDFFTELNPILYWCYAYNILTEEKANIGGDDCSIIEEALHTIEDISISKEWVDIVNGVVATNVIKGDAPNITIYLTLNSNDITKNIQAEIEVLKPQVETKFFDTYIKIPANPVWTYALNAGGRINIGNSGNTLTVNGDVIASGTGGILINNATTNVNGNVYTSGDLYSTNVTHTSAPNTSINVNRADSSLYKYKNQMFADNGLFLDTNEFVWADNSYDSILEESGTSSIDILFRDYKGGNSYSNSLLLSGSNNSINVAGNVWTNDDIEMNGNSSHILVTGNYIGVRNEGKNVNGDIDPNYSSAVINNRYKNDSSITISGDLIVPGLTFVTTYKEDGSKYYYRTLESVTANNPEIFNMYMSEWSDDPEISKNYIPLTFRSDGSEFTLQLYKDDDAPTLFSFIEDIINNKNPFSSLPESRIEITSLEQSSFKGYTAGYVYPDQKAPQIIETTTAIPTVTVRGIYDKYQETLYKVYESKSNWFGAKKKTDEADKFNNYVDKSLNVELKALDTDKIPFLYIDAVNYNLNLTDGSVPNRGIIYSEGDLNITANGQASFSGTIIAEGDITINGNLTINYNESEIIELMAYNTDINNFFKKGALLSPIYYSAQEAGMLIPDTTYTKRYKILKWKETAN